MCKEIHLFSLFVRKDIKFKKDGTYIFRVSVRCVIRYAKLQPIKQNRIQN